MAALVRACAGCYDGAKAYRTPFVSGKDSLNNQLTIPGVDGKPSRTIEIPYTLLISGIGIVPELKKCVTMDLKRSDTKLFVVGPHPSRSLGGSLHAAKFGVNTQGVPTVDLDLGPVVAKFVAEAIRRGLVLSAHDVSDGGLLCAVAEMLIAGSTPEIRLGAMLELDPESGLLEAAFGECASRYVIEVAQDADMELERIMAEVGGTDLDVWCAATTNDSGRFVVENAEIEIEVEELAQAWRSPLDW